MLFGTDEPNDIDLMKALGSAVIPVALPYGDILFFGVGENGSSVKIISERKKIGDLVSCILSGRYMFQAQGAKEEGKADVLILVVEGRVRSNPDDGLLEIPVWGINPRTLRKSEMWQPVQPAITHSRFTQFLFEVSYLIGVQVVRTENVRETACVIKAVYSNFQQPPEAHNSLHTIFKSPLRNTLLVRPSLLRRIASELPGIGFERSRAVAEKFHSVVEMVNAGEKEWTGVEGVGKITAQRVVKALGL